MTGGSNRKTGPALIGIGRATWATPRQCIAVTMSKGPARRGRLWRIAIEIADTLNIPRTGKVLDLGER